MRNFLLTSLLLLAAPAFADDAADVWRAKCRNCHGEDGKAQTKVGKAQKIDDFSNAAWQAKHTDADIKEVIRDGVPDTKMKPYKEKLSAEEIDALVQYIRGLKAQ